MLARRPRTSVLPISAHSRFNASENDRATAVHAPRIQEPRSLCLWRASGRVRRHGNPEGERRWLASRINSYVFGIEH
jgi:hypothetical protein